MSKAAFWIWLHVAFLLTGVFVTVLLLVPSIQPLPKVWFALATVAAMGLAVPLGSAIRKAFT